jgi:hypothetical protein
MRRTLKIGAAALCGMALWTAAGGAAAETWELEASLYGYFPTIEGTTTFPPESGLDRVSVDAGQILQHLKFAFNGSFEARRGPWGVYTDLLYMDVGDTRSGSRAISIGGSGLPAGASASAELDVKTTGWEIAATCRGVSTTGHALDVLAGARLLDVRQKLDWRLAGNVGSIALPDRSGAREAGRTNWDAIVGVKGRAELGAARAWFVPYYLDAGAGESQFTWQAMIGLGYAFRWGDVFANWRHIDYHMKSGDPIERLSFDGPSLAVTFRW